MSPHDSSSRRPALRHAVVIGAGAVGTCSALYLRREGFRVTLVDRAGPGEGCSSGNAGNMGTASCVPYTQPDLLWKVPRMMFDSREPLVVRWRHFPSALPWFLRFARASTARGVETGADALVSLQRPLFEAYHELLAAAGAPDVIERSGRLYVYESERLFRQDRAAHDIRRRRGVIMEELDEAGVRALAPQVTPRIRWGVLAPESGRSVNPLRMIQVLAAHFQRTGGTLRRALVRAFDVGPEGPRGVLTDSGTIAGELFVIAAGAWSAGLARGLGTRVPIEAERGYHVMMPDPGVQIRLPLVSVDRNVAISPMENGLRVSGIAEFAGLEAAPDYRLADRVLAHAREVVPGLRADGASRWMGCRPATPDSLPVIGRSPRFANVLFAFGHGHVGMASGAITGRLIGELAVGRPTSVDLSPFRPDRF